MKINRLILKPILTEKATNLVKENFYCFEVDKRSNKNQIKNEIEKMYKVKVSEIKTIVRKGKQRRVGKKMISKKLNNRKIALIKLAEGKIDLFPQA